MEKVKEVINVSSQKNTKEKVPVYNVLSLWQLVFFFV